MEKKFWHYGKMNTFIVPLSVLPAAHPVLSSDGGVKLPGVVYSGDKL